MSTTESVNDLNGDVNTSLASPKEEPKKGKRHKSKKKIQKCPGAPKPPISAYFHFSSSRRDSVRKECPDISFTDISKKMSQEWSQLSVEEKQTFSKMADDDKERYNRELADYQNSDTYKEFIALQNEKDSLKIDTDSQKHTSSGKKSKKPISNDKDKSSTIQVKVEENENPKSRVYLDIPIFREEFFDHNRSRENELKLLRKKAIEYEEQNAILQKHVENMKSAINKMEVETKQHHENNQALEVHLEALRKLVISNFGGLTLQTPTSPLTLENVDEFVQQLHKLVVLKPKENDKLFCQVKDIARKLDYSSVST